MVRANSPASRCGMRNAGSIHTPERTSSGADRRVRGGRLQAAREPAKAGPYVLVMPPGALVDAAGAAGMVK
jgi:hypothetical protein